MQQKWANPLMGWTSGKDTLGSQIFHHLTFDSPYVLPALASIPAHNCDRAAQCRTRLFATFCMHATRGQQPRIGFEQIVGDGFACGRVGVGC